MKRIFAVTHSRGPAWDAAQPLEGQKEWTSHAALMDALVDEGFILIGGPLEGTPDVLLIVRAEDSAEIEARFASDPWHRDHLLRMVRAVPWTLRLGKLG